MLRFPLRLTAELARVWFAPGVQPIQFVDAAEILHHDSTHPVSHEEIRNLTSSPSPVIWIGGSEPLQHPGIAHLVRAIGGSGHFVFLETDGTLLRRRIHEFQPVPRLFLIVRLEPGAHRRAAAPLQASAFDLAAEGLRAASLSGFLLCVSVRVHAQTELAELAEVIQFARSLGVDGVVITSANGDSNSARSDSTAVQRTTAEARKLIGSKWWEVFSRLVEPILSGERIGALNAETKTVVHRQEESQPSEEGIKVA